MVEKGGTQRRARAILARLGPPTDRSGVGIGKRFEQRKSSQS